jgi:hypothetical protein
MMFVLAIILAVLAVASARDWPTGTLTDKWPTLPTQWMATTIDPPMGTGSESYNFVLTPTAQHPSTMWRNKTAGDKFALQNIPSKGLHRFAAADKKDLLQPA